MTNILKREKKSIFYPQSSLFMIWREDDFFLWFKCLHRELFCPPFHFIFLHPLSLSLFPHATFVGIKTHSSDSWEQKVSIQIKNAILVMMTERRTKNCECPENRERGLISSGELVQGIAKGTKRRKRRGSWLDPVKGKEDSWFFLSLSICLSSSWDAEKEKKYIKIKHFERNQKKKIPFLLFPFISFLDSIILIHFILSLSLISTAQGQDKHRIDVFWKSELHEYIFQSHSFTTLRSLKQFRFNPFFASSHW